MSAYPSFLGGLAKLEGFRYLEKKGDAFFAVFQFGDLAAKISFPHDSCHPLHELFRRSEPASALSISAEEAAILKLAFKGAYAALEDRDKLRNSLQRRLQCDNCDKKTFHKDAVMATENGYYKPVFEFCSTECYNIFQLRYGVKIDVF